MKTFIKNIIIIAFGIAMTTCSDAEPAGIDGGTIMVGAYTPTISLDQSRATTIESNMPETIGVFAEIEGNDKRVFDNQCMYYKLGKEVKTTSIDIESWGDNLWPYTPTKSWIADKNYVFYGYAPYDPENAELIQTSANINTFKFSYIPPIGATEYMVAKANVEVNSGAKPTLNFTHITSRLRFLFAISEKYNQLRTIRITSIKISDSGNGTPYWECSIELVGSNPTINVTQSSELYSSDVDIELIPELDESDPSKPGLELTTEYTTFSSAYNLLGKIANTMLTVTYNVYDKSEQLLREDQKATNVVDLSGWTFERGKCYDVKVLVCPKYLYVLSDNDVAPNLVVDTEDQSTTP